MHYYQHHIGDFIRDTSRLTDGQTMAYLRLMWIYYESGKPLPDDAEALAFKIGSDLSTVAMLLKCYFYADALQWHHKRIDSEIESYKKKSKKASDSAKARWTNAKDMRTHSESNAAAMLTKNQEPITNNHKPITKEEKKETPKKISARFDPLELELPNGLNPSAWESWIAYRRSRKLTCAEPTMKGQLANLGAWWNNGHDPGEIIRASINNGWQGLFEPKQVTIATQPVMSNAEIAKIAMERMRANANE